MFLPPFPASLVTVGGEEGVKGMNPRYFEHQKRQYGQIFKCIFIAFVTSAQQQYLYLPLDARIYDSERIPFITISMMGARGSSFYMHNVVWTEGLGGVAVGLYLTHKASSFNNYPSQVTGLIAVVIERLRNAHKGSLIPLPWFW